MTESEYNAYLNRREFLTNSARALGLVALTAFASACQPRRRPDNSPVPLYVPPPESPSDGMAKLVVKNYDDTQLFPNSTPLPEPPQIREQQAQAPIIQGSNSSYLQVEGVPVRDLRPQMKPRPGRRPLVTVKRVVLHHEGAGSIQRSALSVANDRMEWDAPPYGLIVDYEGVVNLAWAVFELLTNHVADYNPTSLAVSVPGDFTQPGASYSPQQANSIYKLITYLHQRYPNAQIVGHQEIRNENGARVFNTACPADDGLEMVARLRRDLKVAGISPQEKEAVSRMRFIGWMLAQIANM